MTKQEIFNTVCEHLIKQNKRASDNGNCVYRTAEGLKCAVGCLIKDEYYSPWFEELTMNHVRAGVRGDFVPIRVRSFIDALVNSGVPINDSETVDLLQLLQKIHDGFDESRWKGKLRSLAILAGLQQPECIQ